NNKMLFVMMNAVMAVAAALSAYGFCMSNERGNHWVTAVLMLGIIQPMKNLLTEKQQKLSIAAAGISALIAAVLVIAKVGALILNIRYAAIVFMAAVAVLSAAQVVFALMGNKDKKTA
ncbi:MAG: hypothetical protein IIZ09_11130, partial [Ruminococcus sp.]|nr:hypothetical protein [Ruminococcus sp.]